MKFLRADSLPDLMRLQNIVAASLPCPEIFMLHEEKYFREILGLERSAIGVTAKGELIAFSIIRIPRLAHDNLGRDISISEEELAKVAHLQAVAVHPDHRGNGLQRKLTSAHMAVIEEMGCEHVCCTVSPINPISLANYLSCGLVIEGLRPKMQGWWRYILHKNIALRSIIDRDESEVWRNEIRVQISDIEGQLNLLNKGFKGYKIAFNPEGAEVSYAKF